MKKKIAGYFNHPLISGSAIIFIGTFAANVLNFFYNIFMLNHLTRADYGTLASLVSIITLFALAIDSFTPTIVHFAATYFAKKEYDMVRGLFNTFTKGTSLLGIVIFFIFLLFSKQISYFFHIQEYSLIILTGIIVMFNIIFVVNRSMLQAQLAFTFMAIITLLGTILKLLIGILLIFSGLKVYGALLGFVLSFFIPFILSFFSLIIIFK